MGKFPTFQSPLPPTPTPKVEHVKLPKPQTHPLKLSEERNIIHEVFGETQLK